MKPVSHWRHQQGIDDCLQLKSIDIDINKDANQIGLTLWVVWTYGDFLDKATYSLSDKMNYEGTSAWVSHY